MSVADFVDTQFLEPPMQMNPFEEKWKAYNFDMNEYVELKYGEY